LGRRGWAIEAAVFGFNILALSKGNGIRLACSGCSLDCGEQYATIELF
jgi:hypothetical protein